MMSVKSLLETEIQNEIEELGKMELGDDKHHKAVNGISQLLDKSIEMDKIKEENLERRVSREMEHELKMKELEHDRKDRLIKNCLTAGSIVTSVGLAVWGTLKSLKFEETGTVTTLIGRSFIGKLLPKK